MNANIFKESSPCINICKLNHQDICTGCFRTLEEIGKWSNSSDAEKIAINKLVNIRKQAHNMKAT